MNKEVQQRINQPLGEEALAANPNPRANENIRERTEKEAEERLDDSGVGSEITDGEDA